MRLPRRTTLPLVALLAATYFVVGKLSLKLAFLQASASAVWPPTGIALAALLLLGWRIWPALLIGAFFVNLSTAGNIATSLSIAIGNTLEALCAAWLTQRFANGTGAFERATTVFKFALIAAIAAMISATIGVTSLAIGGFADWSKYSAIWSTWWLGDTTGALLVAPLLILWAPKPERRLQRNEIFEAIALLLLLVALGEILFGGSFVISTKNYPISFISGPIMIWIALRFAPRETATGIFALAAIANWGTLHGSGPFITADENESLVILQSWLGVSAITLLAVSAGMAERKRAESAISEQRAVIESASRTKDKFLAMLSHELRTPLTPVLAAVDTLETSVAHSTEAKASLGMIRRNIELERHLIDDLLDLTRIARDKLELHLHRIDAHSAVLNVLEICRSDANERQITLETALAAERSEIEADEAKFQQIVWNLVNNAIKFTARFGVIRVTSSNEMPDSITIRVRDNGVGIDPETLPIIFNPFEQGEQSLQRRFGGLGLGLAIAKSLTTAHGGTLTASSEGRGHGAEFCLTFALATRPHSADTSQPLAQPAPRRNARILLVDDHADTCAALKRLLELRGHSVTCAHSVAQALRAADSDSFDLLVSDIGLPDGDGFDLLARLRTRAAIPAIAISGFGMRTDIEKSARAGFAQHLVKPLDTEILDKAIQATIRDGSVAV